MTTPIPWSEPLSWGLDSSRPAEPDAAPSSALADGRAPLDSPPTSAANAGGGSLSALRTRIEQLDRDLVELIAERADLARRVGEVKRELGLPVLDPAREAAVVRRAGTLAREAGLPDEDVRYLFWHLVGLCRRAQLEGE